MMRYFIALDTGGTKSDAVLFDETGHILFQSRTKGGTPMEIGLEAVCRNTETVLSFLSGKLPNGCIPTAIYCSIAGDRMFEEQLYPRMKPHVEAEHFRVADDGECIITGTLGRVDGGGMVCGTGASLYIRYGDTGRHIGGWGYLIDSGGSGYTMGRAALHAVMREADGRGEKTMLTELIGARMGVEPSRNIQAVYEGGRSYIASFAGAVFEGRKLGDPISIHIFDRTVEKLAEFTHVAARYYPGEYSIALNGGIFANFPELTESLKTKAAPTAKLILATAPPLYGAAVEALWDAGILETLEFRQRFLGEYEKKQ
ncbi:MAG: hypothetical protein HFG75_16930 [Hungatella sp.]|nr:hypothetical protein [Hungatella sp.]